MRNLVKIGVQHNDGKGEKKHCVLVIKRTAIVITSIVFPVALRKGGDDPVDALSFAWQPESTACQEMTQPET